MFFFCFISGVRLQLLFCNPGGGEGHVSRDCGKDAKPKTCYSCGQEGHIVKIYSTSQHSLNTTDSLYSLVIAPTLLTVEAAVVVDGRAAEMLEVEVKLGCVTNAANQGTLLVHAPRLPAEDGKAVEVEEVEVEVSVTNVVKSGTLLVHAPRVEEGTMPSTGIAGIIMPANGKFFFFVFPYCGG